MDARGLVTCSRYAFAPNYYHYCGPEKQNDLLGYVGEIESDEGLANILHHFETLYPYLVLIASENHLKDPFDQRVVDAYWLGNKLLGNVKQKMFAEHVSDTLHLKKKLPKKKYTPMLDTVVNGGVPQHNFHVMNIYVRTGHMTVAHTLPTMDSCRISWGRVKEVLSSEFRVQSEKTLGTQYIVETRPLEYGNGSIQLAAPINKVVTSMAVRPKIGEWVSVHWGFVCEILSETQRKNLVYYTRLAISYANKQHVLE